jgi:hypothetical protein
MTRGMRFFDPCGQQLQIKKIGGLDGLRAHHVHLLEAEWKATLKVYQPHRFDPRAASHVICHVECSREVTASAFPKMIDILSNSFTCDAVPGLSGSCADLPLRD